MRRAAILLPLLAVVLFFSSGSSAQTSFTDFCARHSPASLAAGARSNVTIEFGAGIGSDCIPANGYEVAAYYFDEVVHFLPPDWIVATDADIPDGTKVGTETMRLTLGLLDNGCNYVINAPFDLFDGTTNRNNAIALPTAGTPDRLHVLALDPNTNGVPDGAERWPSYLDSVAEKQGMDLTKLVARIVGFNTTSVSGTTVVVNYMVFEPGARVTNLYNVDPRLGYPMVRVFQDPSTAASMQDPVSDWCAPYHSELTLSGEAGGAPFRGNPGDGLYNLVTFVTSAPDEDGDGIENGLDPCALVSNTSGWDPRGVPMGPGTPSLGDADSDGLPDDCDPAPETPSPCVSGSGIAGHDEDCDGWSNRGDNCPLDENAELEDADGDGLGDACDPNNGLRSPQVSLCLNDVVTIGAGGHSPPELSRLQPCGFEVCDPFDDIIDGGLCVTPTPLPTQSPQPSPTVTPKQLPDAGGADTSSGITLAALLTAAVFFLAGGAALLAARRPAR